MQRTGFSLDDIGLIELNEVFAAQAVAVIRELGLNEEIVTVNGGVIALGHPLGCTGAKMNLVSADRSPSQTDSIIVKTRLTVKINRSLLSMFGG